MKITTIKDLPFKTDTIYRVFLTYVTRHKIAIRYKDRDFLINRPTELKVAQLNTYVDIIKKASNNKFKLVIGKYYNSEGVVFSPVEDLAKKRYQVSNRIKVTSAKHLPDELNFRIKVTIGKCTVKHIIFSYINKDLDVKFFKIYKPRSFKDVKQGDVVWVYSRTYGTHSEYTQLMLIKDK